MIDYQMDQSDHHNIFNTNKFAIGCKQLVLTSTWLAKSLEHGHNLLNRSSIFSCTPLCLLCANPMLSADVLQVIFNNLEPKFSISNEHCNGCLKTYLVTIFEKSRIDMPIMEFLDSYGYLPSAYQFLNYVCTNVNISNELVQWFISKNNNQSSHAFSKLTPNQIDMFCLTEFIFLDTGINELLLTAKLLLTSNRTICVKTSMKDHGLMYTLCRHKITPVTIKWLFIEYPQYMITYKFMKKRHYPINTLIYHNKLTIEIFTLIFDHLINYTNLFSTNYKLDSFLHAVFHNKTFNGHMFNYLWKKIPQLDITRENTLEVSPLFVGICFNPNLYDLLQVIKSYEPVHSRTQIKVQYTGYYKRNQLSQAINKYAMDPNQSTINLLIKTCGELFPLIEIKYLTQDICNQFYSSKYFKWTPDPDQEPLIKLIPEQFQTNLLDVNSHGQKTKPALRAQLELE